MAVVIAGCGDLGTETGLRFTALGHRVIGLRRSAEKLPREIEGQSVDLSVEVPTLPADTDIVVIAMSPDERSVDGYRAAYVDSVVRVVAAIRRDCTVPPRVLFVSSTAVYGVDDGGWVDESTPAEPTSATAVVLREAEETLLEQIPEATILRLGGIYGPGRNRQIDRIRDGVDTVVSEPRFTNRIHRDDAAAAIVHLMTMQDWPKTVYIGVDDGAWVDASTPAKPTASTAVVLQEAEETLLEQIPEAAILRLGGIYGPGRNRQIDRIRDGVDTVVSEPRFTNQIHRDDAAAAIVHLMTMQDRPKTVYIGVDDRPVDHREIVEFLARSLDLPVPSGVADSVPTHASRGKRCHNTRLRESGFVFSYPTYREGYAAVLEGTGARHA